VARVAADEPRQAAARQRPGARLDRLPGDVLAGGARAEADGARVRLQLDDDVSDAVERRLSRDRVRPRERELLQTRLGAHDSHFVSARM
jgi:hypothetical protein